MNRVTALQKDGYWPSLSQWDGITAVLDHLDKCPAYTGHVWASGDRVPRKLKDALAQTRVEQNAGYACYHMADLLSAPGLLDFIVPMHVYAQMYFNGERPRLYSVNAFWKKPGADQDWHVDTDDRKVMVMFMYGTGIFNFDEGPHEYLTGSHHWSPAVKHVIHKGGKPDDSFRHSFYGPSGTWFLTDTNGLHVGRAPKENPRLLFWARWGVSDPPHGYKGDQLEPVRATKLRYWTDDPEIQERTKLVIDWSR